MWQQVGSGDRGNLDNAKSFEDQMNEGQRGQLVINFMIPLPSFSVDGLRNSLNFAGVEDLEVSSSGSQLTITWRKSVAWIPIIILAIIALAILIVSWQMLKEVANAVITALGQLGPVGVFLIVVVIGAALIIPYFLAKKVR